MNDQIYVFLIYVTLFIASLWNVFCSLPLLAKSHSFWYHLAHCFLR